MSMFATNEVEAQVAQVILGMLEEKLVNAALEIECERYGKFSDLPHNQELKDKWAAALVRIKGTLAQLTVDGYPTCGTEGLMIDEAIAALNALRARPENAGETRVDAVVVGDGMQMEARPLIDVMRSA